jgi:hypothetical protein
MLILLIVLDYEASSLIYRTITDSESRIMFTPSRHDVRSFFMMAWQKHQAGQRLSALEKIAADIILLHPEYHYALQLDFLDKDYLPEHDETNPFLHMSLHLTIAEQLAIDQPKGIRSLFLNLCQKASSAHEAEHMMMDSLIEMMWQANRTHTPPDVDIYLNGLHALLGQKPVLS